MNIASPTADVDVQRCVEPKDRALQLSAGRKRARQGNHAWGRKTRGAMQCQMQYTVGIYAKLGQKFAKLTKMQSPFAKLLNRSFEDFLKKECKAHLEF